MPKIFISYRRADSEGHTGRIGDRLAAQFGDKNIFIDVDIRAGDNFLEVLNDALSSSHVVVAVVGRDWQGRGTSPGRSRIEEPATTFVKRLQVH